MRFLFPVLNFAPLVPISALEATDVGKMLDIVWQVYRQLQKRVDTAPLNEALKQWTSEQEPPRSATGYFKVLYATQVSAAPVRFLLFVNKIHGFPETYISYLKNCIRRDLGFTYVPVEISLRERRRNPSLNEKGPTKEEKEIRAVMKKSTSSTSSKKGTAKKPGGKARIGKERERAEIIVRNTRQKKSSKRGS